VAQATVKSVISKLLDKRGRISAADAEEHVPAEPGIYAIFVDRPGALPEPFCARLHEDERQEKLNLPIYVGRASKSLKKRLANQDLRGKGHSTFFRGIGAVLGKKPRQGSLVEKRNQRNYRFSEEDTEEIIRWIIRHIAIKWMVLDKADSTALEPGCIARLGPVFNTKHNPRPVAKLAELRRECKEIASSRWWTILDTSGSWHRRSWSLLCVG